MRPLWKTLLTILVVSSVVSGDQTCGGKLTEPSGILQSPSFPNEFPVPIFCEWIIDSTEIPIPDKLITVYLTQLFVFEGLTFEEYETYDKRYNIPGKLIHVVSENNISRVRTVRSNQNVLVITFQLETIENTHLRVLDNLLDVYGFNFTYEISPRERNDSCIMADCGYVGMCYSYHTHFGCDCFSGYQGPNCSNGRNSLCTTRGKPVCQNGAICKHIGAAATSCTCRPGYSGEYCQYYESSLASQNCEDCFSSCSRFGRDNERCGKCSKAMSAKSPEGLIGYSAKFVLQDASHSKEEPLKTSIQNEINRQLKMNFSKIEHAVITKLEFNEDMETLVMLHVNGPEKDGRRLESFFQKISSVGNALVKSGSSSFRRYSYLIIKSVSVSPVGAIREGEDFVVSCVVLGSPNKKFKWFKDGLVVNTNTTSNKWIRTAEEPNTRDQFTIMLGVEQASVLDQGSFTCQVEDSGYQHCLSTVVEVTRQPEIKIDPMSLTVQKGESFTIKCISVTNKRCRTKYIYSWTKNKELLPVKAENEEYEILYPGGSLLQVSKLEKSATYSCLVQDEVTSTEEKIHVDVIDGSAIRTCKGEKNIDVLWPETAPGTQSVQECPVGYTGTVRRSCVMQETDNPSWQVSDYSMCTADRLKLVETDFKKKKIGYGTPNVSETLQNYRSYVSSRRTLLPGEGERVLSLLEGVIDYSNSTKDQHLNIYNLTTTVFSIIDKIMNHKYSLMNQSQVIHLQHIVKQQLLLSQAILEQQPSFHQKLTNIEIAITRGTDTSLKFIRQGFVSLVPTDPPSSQTKTKEDATFYAVAFYKNLSEFLPLRSAVRLRDGTELEYEIISSIAGVWIVKDSKEVEMGKLSFVVEFFHDEVRSDSSVQWNINCSLADYASYGYSWDLSGCYTLLVNSSTTRCVCSRAGTVAVLLTTKSLTMAPYESRPYRFTALVGCSFCLLLSLISMVTLFVYWTIQKSCLVYLKVQCCFAIASCMTIFVTALSRELPKESYPYTITILQIFLLIALSSHISKLLIVFTEVVEPSQATNLNLTIVAIATGVPVITVFGSHLSHETMGNRIYSWWLISGSLSYNIFIICFFIMTLMFLFVYFTVMRKLASAVEQLGSSSKILNRRRDMLRRSALIFCVTAMLICSSIIHVNAQSSSYGNYLFSLNSIFLGLMLFICYVFKSETPLRQVFRGGINVSRNEVFFTSESTSHQLNLVSKEHQEQESQSGAMHQPEKCRCDNNKDTFFGKSCPDCRNLEKYTNSPKQYKKQFPEESDLVATRVCVELDLVAQTIKPKEQQQDTPILLCNIAVNSKPSCSSFTTFIEDGSKIQEMSSERLQPEGREKVTVKEVAEEKRSSPDSLDGMLDKISHDLDYLLNRNATEYIPPPPAMPRPRGLPEVIQEEDEEEPAKVPDDITDISRTDC